MEQLGSSANLLRCAWVWKLHRPERVSRRGAIGLAPLFASGWLGLCGLVLAQSPYPPGQYPPGMRFPVEATALPSSTPPPVIPPPTLSPKQTLTQLRVSTFKDFIHRASEPEYRLVDGQIYNLKPLSDFLLSLADEMPNPETSAKVNAKTRPLINWTLIYGRVAQVTERSGILLWEYDQPEMVLNPKLVCLRNFPGERGLVDGNVVVAFARVEGPFSYIDSQHSRSTVTAYDFGKPVTKQQVDAYLQRRASPAARLPPPAIRLPTNIPSSHRTNAP